MNCVINDFIKNNKVFRLNMPYEYSVKYESLRFNFYLPFKHHNGKDNFQINKLYLLKFFKKTDHLVPNLLLDFLNLDLLHQGNSIMNTVSIVYDVNSFKVTGFKCYLFINHLQEYDYITIVESINKLIKQSSCVNAREMELGFDININNKVTLIKSYYQDVNFLRSFVDLNEVKNNMKLQKAFSIFKRYNLRNIDLIALNRCDYRKEKNIYFSINRYDKNEVNNYIFRVIPELYKIFKSQDDWLMDKVHLLEDNLTFVCLSIKNNQDVEVKLYLSKVLDSQNFLEEKKTIL